MNTVLPFDELGESCTIPADAYEKLPYLLGGVTRYFEGHLRDIVLTGAFPVLGACMPNVAGRYGMTTYAPPLYTVVVTPPGGGKGNVLWSRRLGQSVHAELLSRSPVMPEGYDDAPTLNCGLFLAANASASAFHHALHQTGGWGVIFESEIDAINNAKKTDWGDYSEVLRKAFEHEPVSLIRMKGTLYLERPSLSLVLAGTPGQFTKLIPSAENGLMSRVALYAQDHSGNWMCQRPSEEAPVQEEHFEEVSKRILRLYEMLRGRSTDLQFTLSDEQWQAREELMKALHDECEEHNYPLDVVRRNGVIQFRLAMILAVLRAFETGDDLSTLRGLHPSREDFEAATQIGLTYLSHTLGHAVALGATSRLAGLRSSVQRFYAHLPSGRFKRMEAVRVAGVVSLSPPTAGRYLKQLVDEGLLLKPKYGVYEKTAA